MSKPIPDDAILLPDEAERKFSGEIFDVYQWQQTMFDNSQATYEMLKRPDTVYILGVEGEKVVLIDQTQPNRAHYRDVPAGKVDENENPLTAAKREMKEETGMSFKKWSLKHIWQMHPKIEWFSYFFVAETLINRSEQQLENGEKIKVSLVEYDELVRTIKGGQMLHVRPLVTSILNGKDKLADILKLSNIPIT